MATDAATPDGGLLALLRLLRAADYAFITPTPATHERVLRARPGPAQSLQDVFGWSMPFAAGSLPPDIEHVLRAAGAVTAAPDGARSLVRVSSLAGKLFLHSAFPTGGADAVFFGPDTYRFARAIAAHRTGRPVRRAVDVCCGSGPGAVVIADAWPGAEVFGTDINPAALRLARVNASAAALPIEFRDSDLLSGVDGAFDLIVANPPYLVDPGERTYRHGGGPLGAGLSLKILEAAVERLSPGGTLLLYTGAAIVGGADPFRDASRSRLQGRAFTWRYEEIDPDVFGEEVGQGVYAEADRIAAVLLTVTKNEGIANA